MHLLTLVAVLISIELTLSVRLMINPDSSKCLTKKMLISCYTGSSSRVIQCGTANAASSRTATEVLLQWDHNTTQAFTSNRQAQLTVELSKPPNRLNLVVLDLNGEQLCTSSSSGAHLVIKFQTYAASTRLAFKGLRLPAVGRATLHGDLVINTDLLDGLPSLDQLEVSDNNISTSLNEPLAKYAVIRASRLQTFIMMESVHSASYSTPLLASLPSLRSARISNGNMLLLRAGTFIGLPALKYLYLSVNNIRRLESGCFDGLLSLEHLQLSVNGLDRLDNYVFSDLANLLNLNLARNQLSDIASNAFHGLIKLTHLDLSDNKLAKLSEFVFVQLHSLQVLNLASNELSNWARNDTFCPLGSLQTLWTDSPPVDCMKFSAELLVQQVRQSGGGLGGDFGRPKKYDCDIRRLAEEKRPCHRWLDRLMLNKSFKDAQIRAAIGPASGDADNKPREAQPTNLTVVLLIVFSIVCLIHVLTTGVTLYVCRRMRQENREGRGGGVGGGFGGRAGKGGAHPWNGRRRVPSLTTPLEEEEEAGRSLKAASSGGGSNEGGGVLVSFQSGGAGAGAASAAAGNGTKSGKSGVAGNSGSSNMLSVRDKNYDFNEDEPRS